MIQFFDKYRDSLNLIFTNNDILDIAYYCDNKWYTTILKNYGVVVISILIKYYEHYEKYEICQELKLTVKHHNKNFGTNYKLKKYE